jgi:DNA-binding MltR family transcriptional regulator
MNKTKPDTGEIEQVDWAYFKTLFDESDRGCVLLTASRLDEMLEKLHRTYVTSIASPEKKVLESLFSLHAPLSSFSAKMKLAFCYGLISKEDFADFEALRKIRNSAAHTTQQFTFGQSETQKTIAGFTSPKRVPQQLGYFRLSEEEHRVLQDPSKDYVTTKMYLILTGMCLTAVLLDKTLRIVKSDWNALNATQAAVQ